MQQIPNLSKEQKAILLIITQHGELWANDFMDSAASALAVNGCIYLSGKGYLYKGSHYVILNEMRNAILKDRRAMDAFNESVKSIDKKWGYIIEGGVTMKKKLLGIMACAFAAVIALCLIGCSNEPSGAELIEEYTSLPSVSDFQDRASDLIIELTVYSDPEASERYKAQEANKKLQDVCQAVIDEDEFPLNAKLYMNAIPMQQACSKPQEQHINQRQVYIHLATLMKG